MAEAAQNMMADEGGAWKETLAGEDEGVLEQLSGYQSPKDFLEEFNKLKSTDWRQTIAGEDEKFKSQLDRFKSPAEFGNAFREAQQKIRSGQFKDPLPADADEKSIQAYREQHGIPGSSEGYLENLPEGLVVGE